MIHELMHAIGFWHEHTRPDRGKHVKIIPENIIKGQEHNFWINNINNNLVGEYDICSVMHYSTVSKSKNKTFLPTMVPLRKHCSDCYGVECNDCHNCFKIGHELDWNHKDIEKINLYYGCKEIGN